MGFVFEFSQPPIFRAESERERNKLCGEKCKLFSPQGLDLEIVKQVYKPTQLGCDDITQLEN